MASKSHPALAEKIKSSLGRCQERLNGVKDGPSRRGAQSALLQSPEIDRTSPLGRATHQGKYATGAGDGQGKGKVHGLEKREKPGSRIFYCPGIHEAFLIAKHGPSVAEENPDFTASIEPDVLRRVEYITRDSVRFKDTGAWGYARFVYDAKSGAFSPYGQGKDFAKECFACHSIVAKDDFIFTNYTRR